MGDQERKILTKGNAEWYVPLQKRSLEMFGRRGAGKDEKESRLT